MVAMICLLFTLIFLPLALLRLLLSEKWSPEELAAMGVVYEMPELDCEPNACETKGAFKHSASPA